MTDRYTKIVLTVIATALVYLCILLTPLPAAYAQTAPRPGMSTGPAEAVIVGWRTNDAIPVMVTQPVRIADTVRVTGNVKTERSDGVADRTVIVGWEDNAIREKAATRIRTFSEQPPQGLPITTRSR